MAIITQVIFALIFIIVGFIIGLLVGMMIWRGKEDTSSHAAQHPPVIEKPRNEQPSSSSRLTTSSPSQLKTREPASISMEPVSEAVPAVTIPQPPVNKPGISPLPFIPDPAKDPSKKVHRSVAEAVDEILQEKLITSPHAKKRIRLTQGTHGEVVIWVGAVRYNDIDAIPDADIRKLIREAAAEWEHRSG